MDINEFVNNIKNYDDLSQSEKIDFFAYYLICIEKKTLFKASDISNIFSTLREKPYSNIPRYIRNISDQSNKKHKDVKYIKNKEGYTITRILENNLKDRILQQESNFLEFEIDLSKLDRKPSSIPFLNSSNLKDAHFFAKLYFLFYHIENSIRNFLKKRLSSIIGSNWENEILAKVDLSRAQSIRKEVDLSSLLPNRGDNILFYCMWDDYGNIIQEYRDILHNPKEINELIAHLRTLTKIRNAIAHNVSTIPKEYQDELTVFLNKFIKILNSFPGK